MTKPIITDTMRKKAYFVYEANHARSNVNYPIALEIYKQNGEDEILFSWEMNSQVIQQAKEINDILFDEYLKTL